MTALEYLQFFQVPSSREGDKLGKPSNSELKRWLLEGAVVINGAKPKHWDIITFPIEELVFFPSSPNRVTIFSTD